MLIAMTKEIADKFDIELKYGRSKSLITNFPPLDDWVLALAFDETDTDQVGFILIHTSTLFSLFVVVSQDYNFLEILAVCYEQLEIILNNHGFKARKYHNYFKKLFTHEIIISKHDNKSVSAAIGYFKEQLFYFELPLMLDKTDQELDPIDLVNRINNLPRKKFDFKSSTAMFFALLKYHINDPIFSVTQQKMFKTVNSKFLH
jgi:hypothetical protein